MREGVLVELPGERALALAVIHLRALGYRDLDAFAPFPSEEIIEAMRLPRSPLPLIVLVGAIAGGALAYLVMWWTNVADYPLNVGGRQLHAWPAYIPITFETTVLFGGLAAFFGFFVLCRLPKPWTEVFEVAAFRRATNDGFFLAVWASDHRFDGARTVRELERFAPVSVARLPSRETAEAP